MGISVNGHRVSVDSLWESCSLTAMCSVFPSPLPSQVCLVECEGNVSPAFTWDMCRKPSGEGGLMYPVALQRFDHVVRALGIDELGSESRLIADAYNSQLPQEMQERDEEVGDKEEGDNAMEREQDGAAGISLSKRFGGFLKGRHGYRKLMGPGRPLQKRYGGFIGVRKSARKWNNQKRFSEFLKQYLGMSTRASKSYNRVSADITQQNKV
uniref:Prepronociceptin a n=1 Tax=Hucho hucho TaxID=62062 RepID=A0A4W5KIN0_9TELE